MNYQIFIVGVVCLSVPIFGQFDQPQFIGDTLVDPNRHREYVDPSLRYQLEWFVDWNREQVIFNVSVATHGNIILGLSLTEKPSLGADIVIGGVSQNGKPYFGDYHISTGYKPVLDRQQNWKLLAAWESSTHTHLTISRPFDTCDQEDIIINDNTLYIPWGYGDADQVSSDLNIRGSFVTNILDPDYTPQSVKDFSAGLPGSTPELGGGVHRWNIHEDFHIPPKETTYWCKIKKLSLPRKMHTIGQNILVNLEARVNVRSMLLLRCNPPLGLKPQEIFEPFLNYPGEECYDIGNPIGLIPTLFCSEAIAGFAIGMRASFGANHVGGAIGEKHGPDYYLLQVQYDNRNSQSNITSVMDLDLYYTEIIRPKEGAALALGQPMPGSPSILVPRGEMNHRIHGHCSSACTRAILPPEGIRVMTVFLHAQRNIGLTIKLQHFRNGRELPPILQDENYQVEFQNLRNLRTEVVVLPGDHLTVSCYYDTTKANQTAVGGWSMRQEMCSASVIYYGLLPGLFPQCKSELISPEYTFRYLSGTTNLTWDQSRLEFMAVAPPRLMGMIVSQISDRVVNWTPALRRKLQRDHIVFPQVSSCQDVEKALENAVLGIPPPPPEFTRYPVEAVPFQNARKCAVATTKGFNR